MDSFVILILAYVAGLILLPEANTALRLGDTFPNFEANTTEGRIRFYDWLDSEKWAVLFSHPADFKPVSTTELAMVHTMFCDFEERNDILKLVNTKEEKLNFPLIADPGRDLAVDLGMLNPGEKDLKRHPISCRVVFIVGPDYKLKLSMLYPDTTGIKLDEILRVIDSLQLTADKKVATPANWKEGGDCYILPSVSKDEEDELFPNRTYVDVPSGKNYMRRTPHPRLIHQNK